MPPLHHMSAFRKPWPFGLERHNWPWFSLAILAIFAKLLADDHRLSLVAHAQPAVVIGIFNWITRWGEADWLLIPSALLLVVCAIVARFGPRRLIRLAGMELTALSALIFLGIGLPSLASNLLKRLVGRSRPPIFDSVGSLSFHPFANNFYYESFPSGHTTTAFSAAMVLGFLTPKWRWLGLLYATAVGLSRLVLGVHYPSDVFGGILLGTLGAYAVRAYFGRKGWAYRFDRDGQITRRRPAATLRLLLGRQSSAAR